MFVLFGKHTKGLFLRSTAQTIELTHFQYIISTQRAITAPFIDDRYLSKDSILINKILDDDNHDFIKDALEFIEEDGEHDDDDENEIIPSHDLKNISSFEEFMIDFETDSHSLTDSILINKILDDDDDDFIFAAIEFIQKIETDINNISDDEETIDSISQNNETHDLEFHVDAEVFIPGEINRKCVQKPVLPTINENEIYKLWQQQPFNAYYDGLKCKGCGIIFIPKKITNDVMKENNIFGEEFDTAQNLYYYLNWTVLMQYVDKLCIEFKSNEGESIIIFNTELHNNYNDEIFIIGYLNDKKGPQTQKWKMETFMIASEIYDKYGIHIDDLPKGSRLNGKVFKQQKQKNNQQKQRNDLLICGFVRDILKEINPNTINEIGLICYYYYNHSKNWNEYEHINMTQYITLEQIPSRKNNMESCKSKKQKNKNNKMNKIQKTITAKELYECIDFALKSYDKKYEWIEIISFNKNKNRYYIDMLLPLCIFQNEWIGILCRDYKPIAICIDCYDIYNKSRLYNASYNKLDIEIFENNISELIIVSEHNEMYITHLLTMIDEKNAMLDEKTDIIQKQEILNQDLLNRNGRLLHENNNLMNRLLYQQQVQNRYFAANQGS